MPRRATQPPSLPRRLAPEPADLRLPRRLPIGPPPKSVTVRDFAILLGRPAAYLTDIVGVSYHEWARVAEVHRAGSIDLVDRESNDDRNAS